MNDRGHRATGRREDEIVHSSREAGLYVPRAIDVLVGHEGWPTRAGGVPVEAILEEWFVTDAWWSGTPVRRRYFELILLGGINLTVFCDLNSDRWFAQRV